jgi:hypothetical protein
MGTCVAGEVGEELVDAEPVGERTGGSPSTAFEAGVIAARRPLVAGRGDDLGAELVDDPVVGVRTAVGALRAEAGDQAQPVEGTQTALAEVQGREQGVGELERGQDAVVVEPAEQDAVAGGELGLDPQDGINHGVPLGERPEDTQGLLERWRLRVTGGLSCTVRQWWGSVRGSG